MTTSKSDFKPIKIFRKEAQLIPYKSLSSEARADILEAYRLQLYDDKKCFKCPTFISGERGVPDDDTKTDQPKQKRAPVDLEALYAQGYTDPVEQAGGDPSTGNCAQCDNYYGTRKMAKTVVYGEKKYLSVPRSSVARLDAVLANHGYAGKRIDRFKEVNPLTKPIKMLLKPYPWQDEAATVFLERKRGMIEAPPRAGKCVTGNTLVMTPEGLGPISSLFSGRSISDGVGKRVSKVSIATVSGEREVSHLYTKKVDQTIRVATNYGYSVQGTPNHKVLVSRRDEGLIWSRLDEVTPEDFLVVSRKKQWLGSGNSLNDYEEYQHKQGDGSTRFKLPSRMTKELARILGYLVANGWLNSKHGKVLSISTNNKLVADDYKACLKKVFGADARIVRGENGVKLGSVKFISKLVGHFLQEACGLTLGLARHKTIPNVLLRGDAAFIKEFIGAYATCDAWISENGTQFCSASKKLIDELHVVLTYFGVVGRKTTSTSYARNGSGIVRNYYNILLHKGMRDVLLGIVTIRKEIAANKSNRPYTDVDDSIPFLKEDLRNWQTANSSDNGFSWIRNGKAYSKMHSGPLLFRNRKGVATGVHGTRTVASKINFDIIEWVDKDFSEQIKERLNPNFFYTQVTSAVVVNKPVRVYDVCVPEKHHFVANGLVNHNTMLGALVVRKLGLKSLIIASQREWLEQFEKTFVGNEATGDKAFTSLSPKRIGMCHTYEDFEKYDVCLATFALFMSSSPQYEPNPEHNEKKYALYKLYTKALRKADKYLKEIKSAPTKSKRDELKIAFGAQKELVKRYIKYRDYVIYGPYLVDPTTGAKIEGERIKTGMNLLKRIRHKFAFVCVDEAHGVSALETSRVLAQFSAEYVMGLSGTPTRKISSQDQVFRMLIGPVIYKAKVERMVPKISLLPTGYTSGVQMAKLKTQYSRMIGKLETDEKRNAVICSAIVKAVKVGHSVMVPMSRINAIDAFAKQLDRAMTAINPTESLVTVFHGKLHAKVRDANLAKIKSGEAKVIVGNIALLSTGLNIPRLTYLIERMTVTSNLPKCKQRVARILTPMAGKLQPVILMLLDNCPLQKVTAKKEFFEGILPDLKPKISKDNMEAFTMWATGSSSYNKPMPSKYAELQGTTSWGAPRDTASAAKRSFSDEFYQFAGGQNAL